MLKTALRSFCGSASEEEWARGEVAGGFVEVAEPEIRGSRPIKGEEKATRSDAENLENFHRKNYSEISADLDIPCICSAYPTKIQHMLARMYHRPYAHILCTC